MSNKTILVVDDEELLRNAIVFQFKREGFNVLSAANGTEAFEIIKTNQIDAVVSDIQMPGGNGIELLKAVKEYNTNIPVLVFITAFADITESEAYDLGANAIFTKPFDRKALVSCIKNSVTFEGKNWKAESAPDESERRSVSSVGNVSVGRGGMFVATTDSNFKVGERVDVDVESKLGENVIKFKGVGKVLWTRAHGEDLPSGMGVEFITLENDTVIEYDKWLTDNNIKPYIPLKTG